ncbi:MAG: RNA repair transcriptional activator RtcR [Hyphomicrobiaceae bacterium]
MKRRVVIGFLGSTLDQGKTPDRWQRWRPTISLVQQQDLVVDRLELIHARMHAALAERIERDVTQVSPETQVRRHTMDLKDAWDFEEVYSALHAFARNYKFDPDREDYLIHITTGTHVAQICWFLLAEARVIPGQLLQITPPRGHREPDTFARGSYGIIDLDLSRYDKIATRFRAEQLEAASFLKSGIPTRNAAFNRMIDRIEQVAIRAKSPMMLTGPTGAGKSQLARRIYELKHQRHQIAGPFVEVNCATLRGDAAMSTLFGHVKGAFTGAVSDRAGLLRSANGGMLFLDEIGELGIDEQAMMLRAIEDKRFMPVGSDKEVASDFQLIAGTNRDLAAAVESGKFREDLLARLALWTFALPGLKARSEDIEPNLDFELTRHASTDGPQVTFNKEARARYLAFATSPDSAWSANFRDLSASITRMATLAPSGRITTELVDEETDRLIHSWRKSRPNSDGELLESLLGTKLETIDLFDRAQLATVIRVCRESRTLSAAGRALFAASRAAKTTSNDADRLKKYLARFGLSWDQITAN